MGDKYVNFGQAGAIGRGASTSGSPTTSMRIDTIYIDMDGVLADFISGACTLFKKPNPWENDFERWKGQTYAVPDAWNMSRELFWAKVDRDRKFWRGLALLPGAKEIVEAAIEAVGVDHVSILSSHGGRRNCLDGKMDWLAKYFPELHNRDNYHFGVKKWHYAAPSCLLIDDQDDNVTLFRTPPVMRAGGQAVLVPRAWNSHNHRRFQSLHDTLHTIKQFRFVKEKA